MPVQLQAALIAALVAVVGWLVTNKLSFETLKSARLLDARLQHVRQQIEELYGPLLGLLRERALVYEIMTKRLPVRDDGKVNREAFSGEDSKVFNFLVEEYLIPINRQISALLREKHHLLATETLPPSFVQFQRYRAYVETLHILWRKTEAESPRVKGQAWPDGIEDEVGLVLGSLRAEYEALIAKGARHS